MRLTADTIQPIPYPSVHPWEIPDHVADGVGRADKMWLADPRAVVPLSPDALSTNPSSAPFPFSLHRWNILIGGRLIDTIRQDKIPVVVLVVLFFPWGFALQGGGFAGIGNGCSLCAHARFMHQSDKRVAVYAGDVSMWYGGARMHI